MPYSHRSIYATGARRSIPAVIKWAGCSCCAVFWTFWILIVDGDALNARRLKIIIGLIVRWEILLAVEIVIFKIPRKGRIAVTFAAFAEREKWRKDSGMRCNHARISYFYPWAVEKNSLSRRELVSWQFCWNVRKQAWGADTSSEGMIRKTNMRLPIVRHERQESFLNVAGVSISGIRRFLQPVDLISLPRLASASYSDLSGRFISRWPKRGVTRSEISYLVFFPYFRSYVTGGHDGAVQVLRRAGVQQGDQHGHPHAAEEHAGPEAGTLPAIRSLREDRNEGTHAQPHRWVSISFSIDERRRAIYLVTRHNSSPTRLGKLPRVIRLIAERISGGARMLLCGSGCSILISNLPVVSRATYFVLFL